MTTETTDEALDRRAELIGEHRPWVTNLILLVIVLGLTGWIQLGEKDLKTQGELSKQGKKVFKFFKPMDVIKIQVRKGGQILDLDRDPSGDEERMKKSGPGAPEGWQFGLPERRIRGRADDALIMRLLKAMEWTEYVAKVPEEDAAKYDFEPVLVTIAMKKKDESMLLFEVGKERAGKVYPVRFGQTVQGKASASPIFLVSKAFGDAALQELNAYRSKDVFRLPKGSVKGLTVERFTPAGEIQALTFNYLDPHWRIDGDFADRTKTEELIESSRTLTAHAIHVDKPEQKQLSELGLFPPTFRLTVIDKNDRKQVLEIGIPVKEEFPQGKLGRYARLQSRPAVVYAVPFVFLAELLAEREDWLGTHRLGYAAEKLFPIAGGAESVSGLGGQFGAVKYRVRLEQGIWRFEAGKDVRGDKAAIDARVNALLELNVTKRLGSKVDEAALGLVQPLAKFGLVEGRTKRGYRYQIHVGRKGDEETGTLVAKRLLEDGSYQVYEVAGLEGVVTDLRNGHLDLLDKTVYAANHWDARKIEFADPGGSVRFRAVWTNPNPSVPRTPMIWQIKKPPTPEANSDDFKAYMKTFDAITAAKYVARVEAADLTAYALDAKQRRTLTIWVQTFKDGTNTDGTPVEQPRRLHVGSRVGDLVHVLPEGGVAVALVEASWLDRLTLGFGKRLEIAKFNLWDLHGFTVTKQGQEVLAVIKPEGKVNWRRAGTHVKNNGEVDRLTEAWESVLVSSPEPATPARIQACGLDEPTWRITLEVKKEGAKTATRHVILLGKKNGPRQYWAMTADGKTLGLFYDDPIREVEAFLEKYPEEDPPFPINPPK